MTVRRRSGALRRFFTPPRFADADKTARVRMVYWMAAIIGVCNTVAQLTLAALVPASLPRFVVIAAVVWLVCLGDVLIARRGFAQAAGWFQTLALWLLFTAAAWTSGGVTGQSITAQLVIASIGALLVGWRGGVALAALSLATIAGLAWAGAAGVLPDSSVVQTAATRAVTMGTYIVILTLIQILVVRDLQGARDRALRRLDERRAAESFSDMLIETAPAIFFVVDAEGRRLRWNRRFEELMGTDAEEFAALGPLAAAAEEDRLLVASGLAEVLETGSGEVVARMGHRGGMRDVLLTGRRITVDGAPCVAGFGLDVTDLKRAESEVRALNDDLETRVAERTSQLEEALRELESFSYSVSHDLRAPLRAINGYATIIESDYGTAFDEEGRRQLERIRENTQRMAQLIDDLLRFSRLGRHHLTKEWVDMAALARTAFEQAVPGERREPVDFELGPMPGARGDPGMLRQVWANLLENAVKFSRGRARPCIRVEGHVADGDIVYAVSDNGVGFDAQYAERPFNVFERLHGSEFEGTGIGLAICKRIVEVHGGRMWCESAVGAGATFSFSLPAGDGERVEGAVAPS